MQLKPKSDTELLREFCFRQNEAAFEELINRHGRMLTAACRQVLVSSDQAQDVAQAAFLVLAKNANKLMKKSGSVGAWLHQVGFRLALDLKKSEARRKAREQEVAKMFLKHQDDKIPLKQMMPRVHEELAKLPEKYRESMVLYHLEEHSLASGAEAAGCSLSAFTMRLKRGREILRKRLVRKGATVSVVAIITLMEENVVAGEMPAIPVTATVKAASALVAGRAVTGTLVSSNVMTLTQGGLKMLLWTKVKMLAATAMITASAVTGGIVAAEMSEEKPAAVENGGLTVNQKYVKPDREQLRALLQKAELSHDEIEKLSRLFLKARIYSDESTVKELLSGSFYCDNEMAKADDFSNNLPEKILAKKPDGDKSKLTFTEYIERQKAVQYKYFFASKISDLPWKGDYRSLNMMFPWLKSDPGKEKEEINSQMKQKMSADSWVVVLDHKNVNSASGYIDQASVMVWSRIANRWQMVAFYASHIPCELLKDDALPINRADILSFALIAYQQAESPNPLIAKHIMADQIYARRDYHKGKWYSLNYLCHDAPDIHDSEKKYRDGVQSTVKVLEHTTEYVFRGDNLPQKWRESPNWQESHQELNLTKNVVVAMFLTKIENNGVLQRRSSIFIFREFGETWKCFAFIKTVKNHYWLPDDETEEQPGENTKTRIEEVF